VRRVLVVGATHGNELTGAWVTRRLERHPGLARRPSLEDVVTVVGNPEAYHATRRFVDADLNRQFRLEDLANMSLAGYEHQRAKVFHHRFGAGASSGEAVDFIVDLHSSTASMGISYIVEGWSDIGLAAAAWCQRALEPRCHSGELPPVRILRETLSRRDSGHLIAMCPHGLMVEIGPVPQGVLRHDACTWMETATLAVLDFLEALNTGRPDLPRRAIVYSDMAVKVPAPCCPDGKPAAVFHRAFQGQDFEPLRKGDPMFVDMEGEVIRYDGAQGDVIWPVFVNEGAYYLPESGLGFGVALREEVEVPAVAVSAVEAACTPAATDR